MYGNGYFNSGSGAAKAMVGLVIIVLIGTFVFGATSVSGALDPQKNADARLQDAKTNDYQRQVDLQRQRDVVDMKTYEAQQQLQVEAEKQRLADEREYALQQNNKQLVLLDEQAETERQLRGQRLAQGEQLGQLQATVIDWGGRVAAVGLALAVLIAASGFAVNQVTRARQSKTSSDNGLRSRQIYSLFEQLNNRLETMQHQLATTQAQLLTTRTQLEQLQTRGDGSDGDGHQSSGTGKLKRLVLVK